MFNIFVLPAFGLISIVLLACEQAPKWGKGQKEKSASRANGAWYGGEKERKGACGHSLNAAVLWYQILVSRSNWLDRWLTALQRILTHWIVWMSCGVYLHKLWSFFGFLERRKSNESLPQIARLIKELQIFLHSVDKKEDVFGMFTDWFRQEFDLAVASLDVERNVELWVFYGCNCHAIGVNNEGQG